MSFSRRRSSFVRLIRVASCFALRASENSSVRSRQTPLGWNPGLYGADERGGVAERGEVDTGGDVTGEGERLDEREADKSCGGAKAGWMVATKDEFGVWDGL